MLTDFGLNQAALAHGPGCFAEDVFQLGWELCYAATGRAPWSDWPAGPVPLGSVPLGSVPLGSVPLGSAEPPGDPDLTGLPAELKRIVAGCLAPDPGSRPSADRLVDWLATAADQRPRSWLPDAVTARLRDYQELPRRTQRLVAEVRPRASIRL